MTSRDDEEATASSKVSSVRCITSGASSDHGCRIWDNECEGRTCPGGSALAHNLWRRGRRRLGVAQEFEKGRGVAGALKGWGGEEEWSGGESREVMLQCFRRPLPPPPPAPLPPFPTPTSYLMVSEGLLESRRMVGKPLMSYFARARAARGLSQSTPTRAMSMPSVLALAAAWANLGLAALQCPHHGA